jgi:Spy/CpxP family protein refolding chaperone
MPRALALAILLTLPLAAQMPKGFYAWWSSPVVKDLNLSGPQQQQIRATIREYRPRLMQLRAEVNQAELQLKAEFDHDPVDAAKTNQVIERLVAARSDLTRTLSQMSLRLRTVLTARQWDDLERRRPVRDEQVP